MMADKTGLRKKSKNAPRPSGRSQYSEQDLVAMNKAAGERLLNEMIAQGKLSPKEVADIVRTELNTGKKDG